MAKRIEEGYRQRVESLLSPLAPRDLGRSVERFLRRARLRSHREGIPLFRALFVVYELTRRRVHRALAAKGLAPTGPPGDAPRFVCDGSLGGLARWLRAAGFEARSSPGVAAASLLGQAEEAILLTSDSRLIRRCRGPVRALWVPTTLGPVEQLSLVLRDLGLSPRDPRCMACGGELRRVGKDEVRERIPPRTALWKDVYFVCVSCDKLFWEGTHWERISSQLRR